VKSPRSISAAFDGFLGKNGNDTAACMRMVKKIDMASNSGKYEESATVFIGSRVEGRRKEEGGKKKESN
jgi:hypothetical protein